MRIISKLFNVMYEYLFIYFFLVTAIIHYDNTFALFGHRRLDLMLKILFPTIQYIYIHQSGWNFLTLSRKLTLPILDTAD